MFFEKSKLTSYYIFAKFLPRILNSRIKNLIKYVLFIRESNPSAIIAFRAVGSTLETKFHSSYKKLKCKILLSIKWDFVIHSVASRILHLSFFITWLKFPFLANTNMSEGFHLGLSKFGTWIQLLSSAMPPDMIKAYLIFNFRFSAYTLLFIL